MCLNWPIPAETPPEVFHQYRCEHHHQLSFEGFFPPFGGKLFGDNPWIKLSELIPWDELVGDYSAQFCRGHRHAEDCVYEHLPNHSSWRWVR